jgi:hypothetical protein
MFGEGRADTHLISKLGFFKTDRLQLEIAVRSGSSRQKHTEQVR